MKKITALAALFMSVVCASATAAEYQISPPYSSVIFKVRYGIMNMYGHARRVACTFEYDESDPYSWRIEAELPVGMVTLGGQPFDARMKRENEFLDRKKYDAIYFESTEVVEADQEGAVIKGLLTVNGIEDEVTLNVRIVGMDTQTLSGGREKKYMGIEVRSEIQRDVFKLQLRGEKRGRTDGPKIANTVEVFMDFLAEEYL